MKVLPVIHILDKEQAIQQANLMARLDCDGFWLINHGGDDELTLSLASELSQKHPNLIVGVNLLSHSAYSALDAIVEKALKYVWLDYAGVHSVTPDIKLLKKQQSLIQEDGIVIFAGTAFKYQQPEPDPVKAAELAQSYGLIVTTSGPGTGHAADINKIESMSNVVNNDLAVASGLSHDNITQHHRFVGYAMIATGISKDEYHVEPRKLRDFIAKVKSLNSLQNAKLA